MKSSIIIIFLFIINPAKIFSQDYDSTKYILNVSCSEIRTDKIPKLTDSLSLTFQENPKELVFCFNNYKSTSIFLFSSYLQEKYYTNTYLNRIDKKANVIKISFLPILPSILLTDRVYINEEKVIMYNQLLYEFIEIKPYSCYQIVIDAERILNYIEDKPFWVKDFDVTTFKQGDKISKIKSKKLNQNIPILFEFAYFNHLDFIFKKDYHLQKKFINDKNSFKVLDAQISVVYQNKEK
jgi:hypothetical protein